MEGTGGLAFNGANIVKKKPRSLSSRRPRTDSQLFRSLSPALASDGGNLSKTSPDDSWGDDLSYRKGQSKYFSRVGSKYRSRTSSSDDSKKSRQNSETAGEFDDIHHIEDPGGQSASEFKRSSEGVLAPANWKSLSNHGRNQLWSSETGSKKIQISSGDFATKNVDGRNPGKMGFISSSTESENAVDVEKLSGHSPQESKLRKVKLKLRGVTHTLHAKPMTNPANNQLNSQDGSSVRPPRSSGAFRRHLVLQGIQWRDYNNVGFKVPLKMDSSGKVSEGNALAVPESVRKSKRMRKRRVLDGDFDDGDDEIQYLERLRASKANADCDDGYQREKNHNHKSSMNLKRRNVSDFDDLIQGTSSHNEKRRKARLHDADDLYSGNEEGDLADENDELVYFGSDSRKKSKKGNLDLVGNEKEIPRTTRQRALQSRKDPSSHVDLVEFPDGLPPAPSKKQKEKNDVELLLKKAEAAQRRRIQVEKAARESEAQAIRKILGQDANGNRREEKMKRQKEEMAQKAERAKILASNTIRWVMGPSGTVVLFPKDSGLLKIFASQPCSYPPPREKCAGPSCTNIYKYRDSKSRLPLCSLQCYKAVNEMMEPVSPC